MRKEITKIKKLMAGIIGCIMFISIALIGPFPAFASESALTSDEYSWIEEKGSLTVGYMNNYLPFSTTDNDGNPTGIVKDYVPLMLENIGVSDTLNLEYVGYADNAEMYSALRKGDIDVAFPAFGDEKYARDKHAAFSTSVISISIDLAYQGAYTDNTTSKIAVNKNNQLQDYYTRYYYPESEVQYYDTIDECLNAVVSGKAGSTFLNGLRTSALLSGEYSGKLKAARMPHGVEFGFAVVAENTVLLSIIDKAIANTDEAAAFTYSFNYIDSVTTYSAKDFMRDNFVWFLLGIAIFAVVLVVAILLKRRAEVALAKAEKEKQDQLQSAYDRLNDADRRNTLLHQAIKASTWTYDINTEDEVTATYYDSFAEKNTTVKNSDNPMSWVDALHPEDKERVIDEFMATIHDHTCNTPYETSYRIMGSDGNYVWANTSGRLSRNEDGTAQLIGISVNITEQMEEQQKRLLGAMPLSSDALSKANIGMWAFELDEGQPPRMYDDETMLGLVGLDHQVPPEEAYHAWYDHIDEGSYDLVNDAVAKMMDGEHAEVQYPWHYPDGRTIIVRCGGVRNFEYTKGIRIEGTHQDVTETIHFDEEERKRSEQQRIDLMKSRLRAEALSFLADNEPDFDNGIRYFGKRILEILKCDQFIYRGIDERKVIVNAPGIDFDDEKCKGCPFESFDSEVFGEEGRAIIDDCSKGYNGIMVPPTCPAKSSYMQRVYNGDKLEGMITVNYLKEQHTFTEDNVDIMETAVNYCALLFGKINEKKSERAKIEAESSNKAKTDFLFSMSHDIRTPMNAILGYTDIGLRHADDVKKTRDNFSKIKSAGGHLLNLINDILEMSRIESGKLDLTEKQLDVRAASRNILYMAESLAAPKDINLTIDVGDLKNPYIYADELHVSEIIINLISNAVKYTPEGGNVTYSVNQISDVIDGKVTYRFEVSDNGIGMSEEFQRHLFEAFSREQTTTVSRIEGTGLGLSIVKKIVDLTGGNIRVKSKQKVGSTFTVEIPFRVMDKDSIEKFREENAEDYEILADISFEGKKLLLVEDNEMNREIATEILEEAGLIVDIAEDGEQAVKAFLDKGADYYDFILMDIQMPVMNGFEATRTIRSLPNGNRIPIVALSANAFEEDKQKSINEGMNDHIAKPINTKELFGVLAKFLK